MITALVLALLAVAAFAWYAPRRAHLLPPRTATYLLATGSVVATGAGGCVMGLAAATAVAQLPPVATYGDLSRPDMRATDPVPLWLAICCGALVGAAVVAGTHDAVRRGAALARLHRDCRGLARTGAAGKVIVLDSDQPRAYATPAGGGRIVVTTGLLAALPADEQRVLYAHESAHLRYRHPWWVLLAGVCAATNPLLRGVARATAQATERWADECAAATVGDRELAARAVARAALRLSNPVPGGEGPHAVPASGAVGGHVGLRVRALLAPPVRPRKILTAGLVLLLITSLGSAVFAQRRTDSFFDLAGTGQRGTVATTHHHHRRLL